MRKSIAQGLIIGILSVCLGCSSAPEIPKEPWIEKPVKEWPVFSLTNEISFQDTTYTDIANSFLVRTGFDTIAVSCKHFFILFDRQLGLNTVDLGDDFRYWKMYPKNNPEKIVTVKQLINTNSKEVVGEFNTLKVRDWIIFETHEKRDDIYPLKIRYSPVEKYEVLYAVGWGMRQKNNNEPIPVKLQCYKQMGDYFYVKTLSKDVDPYGRSGSPVIDENGYLVGIVSGAEGKLGVIGSVQYLKSLFDQYGVDHL